MAIAAAASGGGGRLQLAGHCSCAQTASVPLYMLRCTQQHLKAREARGRASGDRPRGPRRPWIPRRRSRHCPSTVLTIECPCAPLRPLGAPACRRRSTTCSPFNVDVGGGCRGGCSVQGALQACLFRMLVGWNTCQQGLGASRPRQRGHKVVWHRSITLAEAHTTYGAQALLAPPLLYDARCAGPGYTE